MRIREKYENKTKDELVRIANNLREVNENLEVIINNKKIEYIDYIEQSAIKRYRDCHSYTISHNDKNLLMKNDPISYN